MPAPPLYVREYAAPWPGGTDTPDGDTILWQPVIVLPTEGKTTLQFHLGSSPGGYQVLVAGHTLDGRIGYDEADSAGRERPVGADEVIGPPRLAAPHTRKPIRFPGWASSMRRARADGLREGPLPFPFSACGGVMSYRSCLSRLLPAALFLCICLPSEGQAQVLLGVGVGTGPG